MEYSSLLLSKLASAVLLCATALAQTGFETADVHVSPKSLYPVTRVSFRAGQYELRNATMVDLIAAAYGVEPDKVIGGPNWLETDRFDVIAKAPANTAPAALRPMLQTLLKERFQLSAHPDQRPMAAFVLSLGSGKPKLKEADGSTPPGCQRPPSDNADAAAIPATCHALTMQMFVQQLRGAAGDYLQAPVIDNTKLEGSWDFTLKWTPRARLATAGPDGITIFDAIDKQLGLKLESKPVPTPVIVVDRVNQAPSPNAPEVSTALPPPVPVRFEVATVKPTDPKFQGPRVQTLPNGTLNLQGVTLGYLIQTIWFVTPEMIVGAPKWLETDRWDITGKVAGSPPAMDIDSLTALVRALLEERFQLRTHMDERVVPAYTLTAVKPKLRKADPSNRSGCKEGPGADGKDPRVTTPVLSRLVTCRNITMTRFADLLPGIANALNPLNGSIRSTILDATGLDGAWDFTLSFTPSLGFAPNGTPMPQAGDGPLDPNGALSLPDAISRQLGLKLAMEKRPASVLVIDRIEQQPTAN